MANDKPRRRWIGGGRLLQRDNSTMKVPRDSLEFWNKKNATKDPLDDSAQRRVSSNSLVFLEFIHNLEDDDEEEEEEHKQEQAPVSTIVDFSVSEKSTTTATLRSEEDLTTTRTSEMKGAASTSSSSSPHAAMNRKQQQQQQQDNSTTPCQFRLSPLDDCSQQRQPEEQKEVGKSSMAASSSHSTKSNTTAITTASTCTTSSAPTNNTAGPSTTPPASPPSTNSKKAKKCVSFYNYSTVRDYPIILGDNPAVSRGAPLTIDWKYSREYVVHVKSEEEDGENPCTFQRLESLERFLLLKRQGHSRCEIMNQIQRVEKAQRQRLFTLRYLRLMPLEEGCHALWRGFVLLVSCGKLSKDDEDQDILFCMHQNQMQQQLQQQHQPESILSWEKEDALDESMRGGSFKNLALGSPSSTPKRLLQDTNTAENEKSRDNGDARTRYQNYEILPQQQQQEVTPLQQEELSPQPPPPPQQQRQPSPMTKQKSKPMLVDMTGSAIALEVK